MKHAFVASGTCKTVLEAQGVRVKPLVPDTGPTDEDLAMALTLTVILDGLPVAVDL